MNCDIILNYNLFKKFCLKSIKKSAFGTFLTKAFKLNKGCCMFLLICLFLENCGYNNYEIDC